MPLPPPWYRWEQGDLLLSLRLQPRASRDALVGPLGDRYKIAITAPPVEGEANSHLVRFLAKSFGVPRSQVKIESGETSRNKLVRIQAPQKFPIPVENS